MFLLLYGCDASPYSLRETLPCLSHPSGPQSWTKLNGASALQAAGCRVPTCHMGSQPEVGTAPGHLVHSSARTDEAQLHGVTVAQLGKPQGRGSQSESLWPRASTQAACWLQPCIPTSIPAKSCLHLTGAF